VRVSRQSIDLIPSPKPVFPASFPEDDESSLQRRALEHTPRD
jgi:hypothetical protein